MPNDSAEFVHRDHYHVASWDTDARARLSPAALGRYLQETAIRHADVLGFGMAELRQEGLTWVVGSLLIRVHRYPAFQEEVELETWTRGVDGPRALWDFRLLTGGGQELAAVSGTYFLIHLQTRRPANLERYRGRTWRDVPALERGPHRLSALGETDVERELSLRWSDIDLLGHVTNTRYLDLALETYEPAFLAAHEIAEMELNFLAEGTYPDVILSRRAPHAESSSAFEHALVSRNSGRELYRARLTWRSV